MVNYIETRRFFSNIKEEMLVTKDYKKRNELLQQAIQYAIKNKNDLDLQLIILVKLVHKQKQIIFYRKWKTL